MRKFLQVATAASIVAAGTLSYAAGPIYTVPADYEKMKKVAEGLTGTSNLNSVSDTVAKNAGANVKSFVEGATGKSTTSTYSPSYFKAYGNNYRSYANSAVGTDPGGTTSSTNFANAGRNIRSLAEGQTGLNIRDSRYYYFRNAGANLKSLGEGLTGRGITSWGSWYYSNTGRNIKTLAWTFGDRHDPATSSSSWFGWNSPFKRRVDQVYYDTYVNPSGLKKAWSSLSSAVKSYSSNLNPFTRYNEVGGSLGGGEGPYSNAVMVKLGREITGEYGDSGDEYWWIKKGYRLAPDPNFGTVLLDPNGRVIADTGGSKCRCYSVGSGDICVFGIISIGDDYGGSSWVGGPGGFRDIASGYTSIANGIYKK